MVNPRPVRRSVGTPQPAAPAPAAPQRRVALRQPLPPEPAPAARVAGGQRQITTSTTQSGRTVSEVNRVQNMGIRETDGSKIEVGHGKTLNMNNFNGVRIDVRVTLPCTVDTVQETIMEASEHVVEALAREEEYMVGAFRPATRTANRRG